MLPINFAMSIRVVLSSFWLHFIKKIKAMCSICFFTSCSYLRRQCASLFYGFVIADMIARKSGHIVTVGSVVSQLAVAQLPAYCTSKAAAGALLEAVSTDLHRMGGNRGIYTTLICPGHIDTEMFRNVFIRFPSLTPTWSADRAAQGSDVTQIWDDFCDWCILWSYSYQSRDRTRTRVPM